MKKNGKSHSYQQYLEVTMWASVIKFSADDFNRRHQLVVNAWCEGKWFVVVYDKSKEYCKYLRNDCQPFSSMQLNSKDLSGGTYFPTQQDAQQVADRYMKQWRETHATSNAND